MRILLAQNLPYIPTLTGSSKGNRLLLEALATADVECRIVTPATALKGGSCQEHLLLELKKRGIEPELLEPEQTIFNLNQVEVHAVSDQNHLAAYLAGQAESFQPDWVLISSEDLSNSLLEAVLQAAPSRVVYVARTPLLLPFGPGSAFQDQSQTTLLGQTAAIITVSKYIRDYISRWAGLKATYLPMPYEQSAAKPPYLGCFDQGYVTMINPCGVKGISIFLAMAEARPDTAFAAVPGWGTTPADRAALERLPNMTLLPWVDEVNQIYRQSRVVVVPSLWHEGKSRVIVEALRRGVPVLAGDVGGNGEAMAGFDYLLPVRPITHYEQQLDERMQMIPEVPEQDAAPWLAALDRLLGDRNHYEQLSVTAYQQTNGQQNGTARAATIEPFINFLKSLSPKEQTADRSLPLKKSQAGNLQELMATLSPEKRALLALKLMEKRQAERPPAGIPRRPRTGNGDSFPLSFGQQRLWLLDQIEPENPAYHLRGAFRLNGQLDTAAFKKSWTALVERHEILRTTFVFDGKEPVQVVGPAVEFDFVACNLEATADPRLLPANYRVDLSSLDEEARETAVRRLVNEESVRPFNLAAGPLQRVVLLRLAEAEHILIITSHHIISDVWSSGIRFAEMAALYEAYAAGREPLLPELPVQYGDFACWQRSQAGGERQENQIAYWRDKLAGPLPKLELPSERPRPAAQTFKGAAWVETLPAPLTAELKALSRREGVTLFMTLLAAFELLLFRYSGQGDILIGSPVSGRFQPETEKLIGCFLNTLTFRNKLVGNLTFQALLQQVRQEVLGAYANQDLPFEQLLEVIQPQRNLSHTPLFQVLFAFQDSPTPSLRLPGLTMTPVDIEQRVARLDLSLFVVDMGERLQVTFEYNTDLFSAEMIRRMAAHWSVLLEAVTAEPMGSLDRLPMLSRNEERQLLVEWNATGTIHAAESGLTALFARQVQERPQQAALYYEGQTVTYGELNEQVGQLAARLWQAGVGPGKLVAVCLPRSPEAVAALLAVWRVGAAFLPLDPGYPAERLRFMIQDAGASLVLTRPDLAARLDISAAENLSPNLLFVSEAAAAVSITAAPDVVVEPDDPAYVIYTSGSTGRPKGVSVPHRQILNRLHWMWRAYPFGDGEVSSQKTALSFVDSLWEIFGPLLQGVPSLIICEETLRDPAQLVESLAAGRVSRLWVVPSLLRVLLDSFPDLAARLPALTFWVTTGEALTWDLYRRFREMMSHATLYNVYGTSEVWDATWYVPDAAHEGLAHVPIGRPLDNVSCYILDAGLRPVPVGVPGELYVSGIGLGYGYLNRPNLTAERFVPNPFANDQKEAGSVLYRTGDRVRYLADGNIVYIGRRDQQLKVRGYRLEPGEIESYLHEHPAVKQAVVVAREHAAVKGEKWLLAYILLRPGAAVTAEELRGYLSDKVPDFMIPAVFSFLEQLPLTPSGKINRRALPEPAVTPASVTAAPVDAVEQALAEIWAELLGREGVGRDESFFELGGHSLLAVRLFAEIEAQFGPKLPLATLFQTPTVAQLAAALRQAGYTPPWSPLVQIREGDRQPPFYCIHGVGGHLLRYYDLAQALPPGRPIYGLQTLGLDGRQPLHETIEAMAAHYLDEIRVIQPQGPYLLGGLSLGGFVALEMARQLYEQGQEVGLVALFDTSVTQAPRFRAGLSRPDLLAFQLRSLAKKVQFQMYKVSAPLQKRLFPSSNNHPKAANGQVKSSFEQLVAEWGLNVSDSEPVMQKVMAVNRAALFNYVPRPYPVKITLFKSLDHGGGRYYGWNQLALGGVEIYEIPGSHVSIIQEPNVHLLAERLGACIERAVGEGGIGS